MLTLKAWDALSMTLIVNNIYFTTGLNDFTF